MAASAPTATTRRPALWVVLLLLAALCVLETLPRLGEASPFHRYVLPSFSLGFFWDTPLGWTGLVDGVPVNRDSVQFESLAAFLRDGSRVTIPLDSIVYVRFTAYSLLASIAAPLVGHYLGFVAINVLAWFAGAAATYALALRRTGSTPTAILAGGLVATAPAFGALVGQALPYVASYGLFAVGIWFCERIGLFDRDVPSARVALAGLAVGASLLVYDIYMLPAFVVAYGVLLRVPLLRLGLFLVPMAVPRLAWSLYWQVARLPSYGHNEAHPGEALAAWFDPTRLASIETAARAYSFLAAHVALNIAAAFMFVPLLLAAWELWHLRRSPELRWYVAVMAAGFLPAAFMVSTWPHIPRWYVYGYPAIYILAAAGALRLASVVSPDGARRWAIAAAVLLPAIVLANLDVLGQTRPMELLLFQPAQWSYLWSR